MTAALSEGGRRPSSRRCCSPRAARTRTRRKTAKPVGRDARRLGRADGAVRGLERGYAARERLATIEDIREQVNLKDSAVQTPELSDKAAYRMLDNDLPPGLRGELPALQAVRARGQLRAVRRALGSPVRRRRRSGLGRGRRAGTSARRPRRRPAPARAPASARSRTPARARSRPRTRSRRAPRTPRPLIRMSAHRARYSRKRLNGRCDGRHQRLVAAEVVHHRARSAGSSAYSSASADVAGARRDPRSPPRRRGPAAGWRPASARCTPRTPRPRRGSGGRAWSGARRHARRSALIDVREGPSVPCSSTALSVMRRRVCSSSSARRFFR